MEIIGTLILVYLGIVLIAILVGAFFIWLGAKMASVKNATFGRSILAAIGASVVTGLLSWVFAGFTGIGAIVGFLIGLFLSILIIKAVFKIDWGKALLVWVFHVVAEIIAIAISVLTFAGVLLNLFN